jgi:hypothetical protein
VADNRQEASNPLILHEIKTGQSCSQLVTNRYTDGGALSVPLLPGYQGSPF